jgi:hypothetical protein
LATLGIGVGPLATLGIGVGPLATLGIGVGPLATLGIGVGPLATLGIGVGPLAGTKWVVKAFNPIAPTRTDSANTVTPSHLFISSSVRRHYTVELTSGLVPFQGNFQGVCLKSTP